MGGRWRGCDALARRDHRGQPFPPARSDRGRRNGAEAAATRQAVDQEARRLAPRKLALLRTDRAANSVLSLSPFGERVGVRGSGTHRETLTPHPTPLPHGRGSRPSSPRRSPDQRHAVKLVSSAIMARAYATVSSNVARKGCAG